MAKSNAPLNPIQDLLDDLLGSLTQSGQKPTMDNFEHLARDLSIIARKNPPWSAKYMHSLYHGHISPSAKVTDAITRLGIIVDNIGTQVCPVARSLDGTESIPEDVRLPSNFEIATCANPGCPVRFIKTHPMQKYPDPGCRPSNKLRRDLAKGDNQNAT